MLITFKYLVESDCRMSPTTKHTNKGAVEVDMILQYCPQLRPFHWISLWHHKLLPECVQEGWHGDELCIIQWVLTHDRPKPCQELRVRDDIVGVMTNQFSDLLWNDKTINNKNYN